MNSHCLLVFMVILTLINLGLVACMSMKLRNTEHLSPLDNIVTVDSDGNLNALPAEKNIFYCDGSTQCKQPFKAPSFSVGTWVISENTDGHLTFVKSGATDDIDKGHLKFSHDGNIWANRSTGRGWISDQLSTCLKDGDGVYVNCPSRGGDLSDRGNGNFNTSRGDWEKMKLVRY